MAHVMRKRPVNRKTLTLESLLAKQPKSLRKHPNYSTLLRQYDLSPLLKRLRISRRCRSLLDRATVPPENLEIFCRTYRLPRDPFFPLFFLIKREYLENRRREKERRKAFIAAVLRGLPENTLGFIRFLALYEKNLNANNLYPLWVEDVYPKTKKRVHELAAFSQEEWMRLFSGYLSRLERRYSDHTGELSRRLLACYVLEALPNPELPLRTPEETFMSNYRRLCKLHHPDMGGDPEHFVRLKQARDLLIKSN